LVEEFRLDAHGWEQFLHSLLVGLCIVVPLPGGVGDQGDGFAEVGFEHLRLGHVLRDFPKHIVVVPRIDEADFLSSVAQGADDKFDGDDLAEVADMDGTGGGYAGSAGVAVLGTLLPDDFVGVYISPM
jgi:hypothetical protein